MIVDYLIIYQKYSVVWEFQNLYITLALATSAILLSEFIRLQENEGETRYVATQLGLACLASSLSPDEGMHVAKELQRARKAFVLENELHIVYQVRKRFRRCWKLVLIWCKLDLLLTFSGCSYLRRSLLAEHGLDRVSEHLGTTLARHETRRRDGGGRGALSHPRHAWHHQQAGIYTRGRSVNRKISEVI